LNFDPSFGSASPDQLTIRATPMTDIHRHNSKMPATRRNVLLGAAALGSELLGVKPGYTGPTTAKSTPP
jgi:hypothetical protein